MVKKILSESHTTFLIGILFVLFCLLAMPIGCGVGISSPPQNSRDKILWPFIVYSPTVFLITAVGIMKFRSWGRILAQVVSLLIVCAVSMSFIGEISSSMKAGHLNHSVAFSGLMMLPFIFVLYYLNKSDVKKLFRK